MQVRGLLAKPANPDMTWQLLDALSLHPWAATALLETPDAVELLARRPSGLSEDGEGPRRQALGNFVQLVGADARESLTAAWRASF